MSTALYQKDTASRLRAQLRRKAISLYYNSKGPQMTYEEVAKKMQLPAKYIEKWITRYEKTGLHGYVGQRQSAILCIYKKNPNITLAQLRILLKKVGIILSNNELGHILKNLKHILTDPLFKSASEEQILRKLSKVTKVQAKSVIRMNQKMKLEKEKEEGKEHPYANYKRSIYLDHSYVAHPELSYDENDYSLYDNVDKLAKYKTDLMNKIATVSKNLDKLFDSNSKEVELGGEDMKRYKISLLREQLLYLCLEMKGPKLTIAELTQNLPLKETIVTKWIEQAKNIKRYVHAKHVNKCCGKIQESIVRLIKLNSKLNSEEVKTILHHINIDLSNLKLERQLNSVKYMISGPEDFLDKEFEDMEMNESDIDYCIKVLSLKITSINMKKTKRLKGDKSCPKQLSLQNIVDSYSTEKRKSTLSSKITNDHIYQNSSSSKSLENRVEKARHNLHEELSNIFNSNEKQKQHSETSISQKLLNHEKNDNAEMILNSKHIFSGKMNGLNLLQAVTLDEIAKYGITKESYFKEVSPVRVKYNETEIISQISRAESTDFNEDVNLLQNISTGSSNNPSQTDDNLNNQKYQTEQSEVIEEHVYNIDLVEHNIPYEDAVKENTSPNCLAQKGNLFASKIDQQIDNLQSDSYSSNVIIEEPMPYENIEHIKVVAEEVISDSLTILENDDDTNTLKHQENQIVLPEQCLESTSILNPQQEVEVIEENCINRDIELRGENAVNKDIELVKESNISKKVELTEDSNIDKEVEAIEEINIDSDIQMIKESNKKSKINNDATDECESITPTIESTSEEMEAESGIGSLILDGKSHEDDVTDENVVSNLSASSDESNSSNERKRKYSEDDNTFESEESDFEPIDDLSFIGLDLDSDALVKEETEYGEKEIMTEYIECEDNSVVIKYWIAT